VIEVAQILDTTQSKFLQFADSTNGDPWKALLLTAKWVSTQPTVQAASVFDSAYLNITLRSGLITTFFVDAIGNDSLSLFKGGGGSALSKNPAITHSGTLADNDITNKKVLIYSATPANFYRSGELEAKVSAISSAPLGLDVTLLTGQQCAYNIVDSFKNYGFVIIDTHGFPDGFVTGTQITFIGDLFSIPNDIFKDSIINEAGQDCYDKITSGQLRIVKETGINFTIPSWNKKVYLTTAYRVILNTKYIDALPPMPKTVIYGDMCFSGYGVQDADFKDNFGTATPMRTAWMNKTPISYYCFAYSDGTSDKVSSDFGKEMFDTLVKTLTNKLDSTGIANLHSDGSEFSDPFPTAPGNTLLFKHFGADDYSYPPPCPDSFVDTRDGQWYKQVCLGKQTWMGQNLNYGGFGGVCYDTNSANCSRYGKLYDWNTLMQGASATTANPSKVQGVCPKGWHVPSDSEFIQLFNFLGQNAAGAMKSTTSDWKTPNVGATNASGFNALPGGDEDELDVVPGGVGIDLGNDAYFGTTTYDNTYYWHIEALSFHFATPQLTTGVQSTGYSCRCVQDK